MNQIKTEITNIQNINNILNFINTYQSSFNGKGVIKSKLLLINNQKDTICLYLSNKTIYKDNFVYTYKKNIYNTIDSINLKYMKNIKH